MSVVGQNLALKYLNSALACAKLHPSLLFVGPDGVGKKKVALEILAPTLTRENPGDVIVLNREFQASYLKEKLESQTSIKIDLVRYIDNFLHLRSHNGATRVVVIDEAHRLTNDAANALLKLLEEPPPGAQLVLLANDEKSLPVTVVSRCAVVRFGLIPSLEIARYLVREKGVPLDEAEGVAERAGGSFSRALSLLEDEDEKGLASLSSMSRVQFFSALEESAFKRDSRGMARKLIDRLMRQTQRKMLEGSLSQETILQTYLDAKRQIDHHVPARLVLENLYLNHEKILSDNPSILR